MSDTTEEARALREEGVAPGAAASGTPSSRKRERWRTAGRCLDCGGKRDREGRRCSLCAKAQAERQKRIRACKKQERVEQALAGPCAHVLWSTSWRVLVVSHEDGLAGMRWVQTCKQCGERREYLSRVPLERVAEVLSWREGKNA